MEEILKKKTSYPDTFSVTVKEMEDLRAGRYKGVEIQRHDSTVWIGIDLLRGQLAASPMRTNRKPKHHWSRHFYVLNG